MPQRSKYIFLVQSTNVGSCNTSHIYSLSFPQNSFSKFLGACNDLDIRMIKCLKKERLARRAENYKKAQHSQQEQARKRRENKDDDFDF